MWFDRVVLSLIAANTLTLMVNRYPMAEEETYVLDVVNFALSVIANGTTNQRGSHTLLNQSTWASCGLILHV